MVEQRSRFQSQNSDSEGFGEDITGRRARPYAFGRTARTEFGEEDTPLFLSEQEDEFLSDQDQEQDPWEEPGLLRKNRSSVSLKILMGVLAASSVAMLFALFTSDAMRDALDSAKASFAAVLPVPSVAAQADASQLTARDIQLKDPTRLAPRVTAAPNQAVAGGPSREDITTAYQSALQRPPVVAPQGAQQIAALPPAAPPIAPVPQLTPQLPQAQPVVAAPAPVSAPVAIVAPTVTGPMASPSPTASPTARRIDPDELAMLMKRAKGLLSSGDIPPARLLLERAADAQEPSAAFLLAQTYDPDVLGARDSRSISADPEAARAWYQKAAQLGSPEAQRRLAQMQN
jgi:hypothetical protein